MVHLPLLNKDDTSLLGPLSSSFAALFVVPGSNMSSSGPSVLHKWGPSTLNQGWITARLRAWLFMGGHFRTRLGLMQSVKNNNYRVLYLVWTWETSTKGKYGSCSGFNVKTPSVAPRDTLLSPLGWRLSLIWIFSPGWRSQNSVTSPVHLLSAGRPSPQALLMLDDLSETFLLYIKI